MGTSPTSPGKLNYRGLDSRKHLDSGRGRTFFLTSLLIELIDMDSATNAIASGRSGTWHLSMLKPV